jgi:hypothetical protein
MKYKKPQIIGLEEKLPPITTNFAPPPVEESEGQEMGIPQKKNKEGVE